jgi:hypothetical protein
MPLAVPAKPFWKVIDWRLVAACGLPVWAFLLGLLVSPRPARVVQAPESPPPAVAPAPVTDPDEIPMPRAVVVRPAEPEVVSVPLVVPVPVAGEAIAVAAADFQLPASEVLPADRCKTYETKVRFHPTLTDAADEARKSKKMLFVLHISGDFDDPGFT